ncbi:hypothetical protein MAP00_000791 [Monascus purpureus]|nr:hypothetical protein MAP00_000791 [Monascus purpureus]
MLVGVLPTMTSAMDATSENHCPACGQDVHRPSADAAQQRIKELETEVQRLTEGATLTAKKLADYEDELRHVRSQEKPHVQRNNSSISSSTCSMPSDSVYRQPTMSTSPTTVQFSCSPNSPPQQPAQSQGRISSFASLLHYRRFVTGTPGPSGLSQQQQQQQQRGYVSGNSEFTTSELQDALNREQNMRKAAEMQLSQVNMELEELTIQLFSQANEMVAHERRARAKLEERVTLLEQRDADKKKRLERLENAIARVERVRTLVG